MFQTLPGVANWSDFPTQQEDDMLAALLLPEKRGAGIDVLGVLFHRRALDKIGRWDESLYCEDNDYWLRAAWAGCRLDTVRIADGIQTDVAGAEDCRRCQQRAVWRRSGIKHSVMSREKPYRSLLADRLAEFRFYMAVSQTQMSISEAWPSWPCARYKPEEDLRDGLCVWLCVDRSSGRNIFVRSRGLRSIADCWLCHWAF